MTYKKEAYVLQMEPDKQKRIGTINHILDQGMQALIYNNHGPLAFFNGERLVRLDKKRGIDEIISTVDSPGVSVSYRKGRRKVSINPCDVNGFENAEKSGEKLLEKHEILLLPDYAGQRDLYVIKNNGNTEAAPEIGNGVDLRIYLKHRKN